MIDRITQALEALEALTEDEAAAHFFPSDPEIFKTGEHTATASGDAEREAPMPADPQQLCFVVRWTDAAE